MFERLKSSINNTFGDILPHDFCVPCFVKGALVGAGIGLLTMGALAAIAGSAAAPFIAVAIAVVGIAGIAHMIANWKHMNDEQKSEALGGLVGGAVTGGAGSPGIRIPIPTFELVPGDVATLELVFSYIVIGGGIKAAAGGVAGAGTVAIMATSGSTGGHDEKNESETDPKVAEAKSQTVEQRKAALGKDPKRGYVEHEGDVGAEIEPRYGYFERDASGDGEWVSLSGPYKGKSFDLVGIPPGKARFHSEAMEKFLPSIDSHFRKSVDYVVVDVRNMTPAQRTTVFNYVGSKYSSQIGRLILLQ